MKQKQHEFDNPALYRDMKCMACENCYEVYNAEKKFWTGICAYGGPYTSYLITEDYKIPEERP